MRKLYLECNMGAAGDMLMAALLELHPDSEDFVKRFNALGIPNVTLTAEKTEKCGITGTHARVSVNGAEENEHMHDHHHGHGHHHHSSMADIEHLITHLNVPESVRENAVSVYRIIALAESKVHGREMEHIHFHEVGTMDAIADVVGVCMLIDELGAYKITASAVHVGSGQVRCAHGILPVPAPATAEILKGVPIYGGEVKGELCTPTGAALLKHFVSEFGEMPVMKPLKIGYGMGTKDFDTANCLRAVLGETENKTETLTELRCNVDDMTGEQMGFAVETLLSNGALDVFTVPAAMKKNRPGTLLTCLCRNDDRDKMIELIFTHTTTLGIREYTPMRHTLDRREITLQTRYGEIKGKLSEGYGIKRVKPEYEELAAIARKNGISVRDIEWNE